MAAGVVSRELKLSDQAIAGDPIEFAAMPGTGSLPFYGNSPWLSVVG